MIIVIDPVIPEGMVIPKSIRRLPHQELWELAYSGGDPNASPAVKRRAALANYEGLARNAGQRPGPVKQHSSFVYLMRRGDAYKIGHSRNPEARVCSIQTGSPEQIELLAYWAVDDACAVERGLHRRYAHCRLHGEWFALTAREVADLLEDGVGLCQSES
jgi:hypothetical protein